MMLDVDYFDQDEKEVVARMTIPDSWAAQGSCPVCSPPRSLQVQHMDETPDQLACSHCGAAFEVHTKSSHICLKVFPPILEPAWKDTIHQWLAPSELQLLYRR